jgi:hypothetical protein
MDEDHFYLINFHPLDSAFSFQLHSLNYDGIRLPTRRASRRLSSAALLRVCNSLTMAAPVSALHMKASDSCKIQVTNDR